MLGDADPVDVSIHHFRHLGKAEIAEAAQENDLSLIVVEIVHDEVHRLLRAEVFEREVFRRCSRVRLRNVSARVGPATARGAPAVGRRRRRFWALVARITLAA